MDIKYQALSDCLYIYLNGELDEYGAGKIKSEADEILGKNVFVKKVVFDMSHLTFMDSTGIGFLIGRYKKLSVMGIKVYVKNPTITVQKVLEISGLNKLMPKIG